MRKFGGLLNESRELSTKAGKLQEELKKVSAERDELKFLLEATQAQVNVSIMYIHTSLVVLHATDNSCSKVHWDCCTFISMK